jgi:hypothetical protein
MMRSRIGPQVIFKMQLKFKNFNKGHNSTLNAECKFWQLAILLWESRISAYSSTLGPNRENLRI